MVSPIIKFRPYQQEAFIREERIMFLMWSRQRGKSYYLAALAMFRMMERKGHSLFFCNASIKMGAENILKEAAVWQEVLSKYALVAEQGKQQLQVEGWKSGNIPDIDAIADLFEQQKLEARIWHSRTNFSRSFVVSPNPRTARGYTGDIFLDEMGFFEDFTGTWGAVEPFIQSNPEYILRGVTTPPDDDKHPVFDILAPPADGEFSPNPKGNYYETEKGYLVHRADCYDTELAGIPMRDSKTGKPISVDEARGQALDREAFRRNYELVFIRGGSAALSREIILHAQDKGRNFEALDLMGHEFNPVSILDKLNMDWVHETLGARTSLGLDVASTQNKKSNPNGLAVMSKPGIDFITPLQMRWKTNDAAVTFAVLEYIIRAIPESQRGVLVVDASNEKLFAMQIKRLFGHLIRVILISGNEAIDYRGERWKAKRLLGSLLVNQYEDKRMAIPSAKWLLDDHRLVRREAGEFIADVDASGCHADNFDGEKLALWGLLSTGEKLEVTPIDTFNRWGNKPSDLIFERMTPLERQFYQRQNNRPILF